MNETSRERRSEWAVEFTKAAIVRRDIVMNPESYAEFGVKVADALLKELAK